MHIAFYRENKGWLATGLLLTLGSSFGQTFFISLFAGEIRAEFGLSNGAWGQLYTVATLASAAVLVQAGRMADTTALRKLSFLVLLGFAAASLGLALSNTVLALGVAVFGLRFCGQGMMGHIAMTAMGRWFRANRGRAIALAVMGYPIGEALLPPVAVPLIGVIGWRYAWIATAAVILALLLPALMRLMAEARTPQGEGPQETAAGRFGARHWTRGDVLGHWAFWALLPGVLAPSFIGTVVFFHQVHIAEAKGWSVATMAFGYTVYAALSVGSALIAGGATDRIGPRRMLPVYLLPMALGCAVLAAGGSEIAWFATLALFGVTQGVAVTLLGALWPTLYGTRHLGAIKALATSAMVVSTAVGPGITGILIDTGLSLPDQAPAMALWCLAVSGLFATLRGSLVGEAVSR